MSAVLTVDHITKRYGTKPAVEDLSFALEPGRIFGLLGPNGAGKTTSIRMITGITYPDEGTVQLGGHTVGPAEQARMGYLPEERGLYRKMKVGDQLIYLGKLKGLSGDEAKRRTMTWLDRFGAADWTGKKVMDLSKGMQQKVQFIATLLHEPDLLVLDEPLSGLDPINAELLNDIILERRTAGKAILFSTHRMEQVEKLCDDICLLDGGRAVLQGGLREVKRRFGRDTVRLEFAGAPEFLDTLPAGARIVERGPQSVELRLTDGLQSRTLLEHALRTVDIHRFELVEPSLNEIFIQTVGQATNGNGR